MTIAPVAVARALSVRTGPSATGLMSWYLALNSALVIG
jgi:hypothetical protein